MLRGREESVLLVREREWCQCENEFGKSPVGEGGGRV